MVKVFKDPWDIDGIAKELYGEVTPQTRQKAKDITFIQRWGSPTRKLLDAYRPRPKGEEQRGISDAPDDG